MGDFNRPAFVDYSSDPRHPHPSTTRKLPSYREPVCHMPQNKPSSTAGCLTSAPSNFRVAPYQWSRRLSSTGLVGHSDREPVFQAPHNRPSAASAPASLRSSVSPFQSTGHLHSHVSFRDYRPLTVKRNGIISGEISPPEERAMQSQQHSFLNQFGSEVGGPPSPPASFLSPSSDQGHVKGMHQGYILHASSRRIIQKERSNSTRSQQMALGSMGSKTLSFLGVATINSMDSCSKISPEQDPHSASPASPIPPDASSQPARQFNRLGPGRSLASPCLASPRGTSRQFSRSDPGHSLALPRDGYPITSPLHPQPPALAKPGENYPSTSPRQYIGLHQLWLPECRAYGEQREDAAASAAGAASAARAKTNLAAAAAVVQKADIKLRIRCLSIPTRKFHISSGPAPQEVRVEAGRVGSQPSPLWLQQLALRATYTKIECGVVLKDVDPDVSSKANFTMQSVDWCPTGFKSDLPSDIVNASSLKSF
eukprot:gene5157-34972_t